jgi:hypothetical protein
MGALKKILRAIFDDDGAPSLYSGLVIGAATPARPQATAAPGAGSRRNAAEAKTPARRS